MFNNMIKGVFSVLALCLAIPATAVRAEQSPINVWQTLIKDKYFKGVNIIEDHSVIDLKTPYRAEDGSNMPLTITAKIPQTPERYIDKIYLIVDKNPEPLIGIFHLTPESGKADLAMRIRVNEYSNVRAIAVLNNGETHMVTNFVKTKGGCSAPLSVGLEDAIKRIGKMKFRTVGKEQPDDTVIGQFLVSHPMITGMQRDLQGQLWPAHYMKAIKLTFNGKLVMTAQTSIGISADPSFRFFFKPGKGGVMKAEIVDSDESKTYTQEFQVADPQAPANDQAQKL
jgi:sulfur-oxidizing protein SoxY